MEIMINFVFHDCSVQNMR